jgi:hypothetical protein
MVLAAVLSGGGVGMVNEQGSLLRPEVYAAAIADAITA